MRFTRSPLLAAAALVTLALAGCSSGSAAGTASTSETLKLSIPAAPSSFAIGQWNAGGEWPFLAVYDTIVYQAPDGSIQPQLATSWKWSDDYKQLTFTIRRGIKFTDGEALNARAVVESLDVSRKSTIDSELLAPIKSVTAPNSTTVIISLSKADAALIDYLAFSPGAVAAPDSLTRKSSQNDPVGSGPYMLDTAKTITGSVYTFTRNPHYWNLKAYPYKTVTFQVISDQTAIVNALQDGQIDWSNVQPNQLSLFKNGNYTIGKNKPVGVLGLFFVDRDGKVVRPLGSVRVRQAINYALDRKLIAQKINPGSGEPTNQVLMPSGQAYDPAKANEYGYDPAEARKLLAQAGYPHGFPLTIPSISGITTPYESVLSQELGAVGIKVNWESMPLTEMVTKVYSGQLGLFFLGTGHTSDPADVQEVMDGLFNPLGNSTPQLAALIGAANGAPPSQQGAAWRRVNDYFIDQAWFAPLLAETGYWVEAKGITYAPPVHEQESLQVFGVAGS